MSNGSERRGEGQRKEKEQRERCRKSVHIVASDTQVLGAVLFQPNAKSHLCIKQKNRVRKYSPSLSFPTTICSGSDLCFFLFNLPPRLFRNPPSVFAIVFSKERYLKVCQWDIPARAKCQGWLSSIFLQSLILTVSSGPWDCFYNFRHLGFSLHFIFFILDYTLRFFTSYFRA